MKVNRLQLNKKRLVSDFVDRQAGLIFILPAAFFVVFLLAYPIFSSVYYAITNKNLLSEEFNFVGLENFRSVLEDSRFWLAFKNSLIWTFGSVILQLLMGLGVALLLMRIARFQGFFRTLLIVPWAFPSIVIAFTWTWLLNDSYGFINSFLMNIGVIDLPILWLGKPMLSMISMIMINVWFGFPFMMVTILAGLQTIPKDEYEAAAIDGANSIQSFIHITWTHLRKIIGLLAVLRTIWVFNNFEFIFLTTGGGPGSSTETLPLFAYRTGWMLSSIGRASAIATILLVFLLIVTFLYLRLLGREGGDQE